MIHHNRCLANKFICAVVRSATRAVRARQNLLVTNPQRICLQSFSSLIFFIRSMFAKQKQKQKQNNANRRNFIKTVRRIEQRPAPSPSRPFAPTPSLCHPFSLANDNATPHCKFTNKTHSVWETTVYIAVWRVACAPLNYIIKRKIDVVQVLDAAVAAGRRSWQRHSRNGNASTSKIFKKKKNKWRNDWGALLLKYCCVAATPAMAFADKLCVSFNFSAQHCSRARFLRPSLIRANDYFQFRIIFTR